MIKNTAAGNLLTPAAILFSGNTFSRIAQFVSFLKLKFLSHSTFYNIQNKFLFPLVDKAWTEERCSVLEAIKRDGPVDLIGNGRCDSPGHSDKYCTYTVMTDERKVAYFSLVQVTEVTSSNAMEKEGFERCLAELQAEDVTIRRIATDRHTSISSSMNKEHKESKHRFDVWHLSTWVVKQLTKKAKVNSVKTSFPGYSQYRITSGRAPEHVMAMQMSFGKSGSRFSTTSPSSTNGVATTTFTSAVTQG